MRLRAGDTVPVGRQLERQGLEWSVGLHTSISGHAVRDDVVGNELQCHVRTGRRVIYPPCHIQTLDPAGSDGSVTRVQLDLGLYVSTGLADIRVGHNASLHLLPYQWLEV